MSSSNSGNAGNPGNAAKSSFDRPNPYELAKSSSTLARANSLSSTGMFGLLLSAIKFTSSLDDGLELF
jgi:hypothetical protein